MLLLLQLAKEQSKEHTGPVTLILALSLPFSLFYDLFLTIFHTPLFPVFFHSIYPLLDTLGLRLLQGPITGGNGLTCRLTESLSIIFSHTPG